MRKLLVALVVASFFPFFALAETPEEKGLAIAKQAEERDQGFGDFTANLQMILRNKQGDESRRSIRIHTLEVAGDGDKGLSIFDEPADVKGTTMLTFSHKKDDDDQWLFGSSKIFVGELRNRQHPKLMIKRYF